MSSSVETLDTEYRTITEACGLLDRSERGKLALTGAEAKTFLQGQVSNDVEGLAPGQGCYAAFLTPKGKMLGDLRVLEAGDELLLDTERSALQELFNMIRRFSIGFRRRAPQAHTRARAAVVDRTRRRPRSSPRRPPTRRTRDRRDRRTARAARSAPTSASTCCATRPTPRRVAAALTRAGAAPVSEATAECLRIEHGRPRYGVDLDETVIPQEAGLNERAVSFTKGCYVGQETVARLFYRGKPNRQLRGLRCAEPAHGRRSEIALRGPRRRRPSRSVAVSPRFGPIGLALVRREAPPGSTSRSADGVSAEVVELPFS